MTSSKCWKVILPAWLAGCAGLAPALRSEHSSQPAAVSGAEACRDPSALVLLCGERACAFYRCAEVAPFDNAPFKATPPGQLALARGVFAGSPPVGSPMLPHARHHPFPPDAEFRAWFASKGIAPDAWTIPVLVEEYVRIHAGAQGGLWNVAWRELMQANPQATPNEVWSYAGKLCLRFGIFEPVFAGLPSNTPLKATDEELTVRPVDLDPAARVAADKALAECAELASKQVLARRMNGKDPTPRECLEQVSPELEQTLLRQGLRSELLGTIVPDVVLHTGNPARVQRVYDFKFPCVDAEETPPWRKYPAGHPYHEQLQGEIYERALGVPPARVTPRRGVIP